MVVHAAAARTTAFLQRVRTMPPRIYFVGSAVFHYLGPAFAVLLFARVPPLGVAWLRIVSAAAVFALWRLPWRTLRSVDRRTVGLVISFGIVLAVMNACFYLALDRLPLATVAAIEFLPVVLLAALGVRSLRNGVALLMAVVGVYILAEVQLPGSAMGVAFAFANAGLFALYIVLAHRVARDFTMSPIDGLAAAMMVAALVISPIGGWQAAPALLDPVAIGAGVGVGVTSSVIPYICDQLAMSRMSRATYSLMVSLLPATATVVGVIVLVQVPTARDLFGVGLIVFAIAVHNEGPQEAKIEPGDGSPRLEPKT
jgi:inner membrane transporter RhtA